MFYTYGETKDNKNAAPSFIHGYKLEKKVNTYFRDNKRTKEIPRDFALEMRLVYGTLFFHTCKSHVPSPM
jgi:hypothetical protein